MLRELNLNEMEMVSGGNEPGHPDYELITTSQTGTSSDLAEETSLWQDAVDYAHDNFDLNGDGDLYEEAAVALIITAPVAAGAAVIAGASTGVAALVGAGVAASSGMMQLWDNYVDGQKEET